MAKARSKTKKRRAGKKKGFSKGARVFLVFLGLVLLTILLYAGVNQITNAINEAKSVPVNVDMEMGTPGEGPGQFKEPQCVAVDAAGDFYVSDFGAHRVQKFDTGGTLLLSIGKEGKAEGDFEQPSGLFVDAQGDIYVCDTFNHRIEKFDAEGNVLKVWSHSFFGPRSIVGNNQGRIYVADTGNHKIQVFDADGNFLMEWGGYGTADGKFREPVGCALDDQGDLYVADSDNERIQKFDPNGKFLGAFRVSTWRGKNVETPYLAFRGGFLYASNASEKAVLKYDATGHLAAICRKKDKDGFAGAAGVAVDAQDRVYVVEKGLVKIARFTVPMAPSK